MIDIDKLNEKSIKLMNRIDDTGDLKLIGAANEWLKCFNGVIKGLLAEVENNNNPIKNDERSESNNP